MPRMNDSNFLFYFRQFYALLFINSSLVKFLNKSERILEAGFNPDGHFPADILSKIETSRFAKLYKTN